MSRKLLLVLGIITVFVILFFIFGRQYFGGRLSPQDSAELKDDKLEVTVFYNRPSKRGREIFGGLVPFGKVWRTGANEATWFETNHDLIFGNETLRKGRYSLWTIPNAETWGVIFNSNIPPWGIDHNGDAAHNPSFDILNLYAPVGQLENPLEQFTISIEKTDTNYNLIFSWDMTEVRVPFSVKEP